MCIYMWLSFFRWNIIYEKKNLWHDLKHSTYSNLFLSNFWSFPLDSWFPLLAIVPTWVVSSCIALGYQHWMESLLFEPLIQESHRRSRKIFCIRKQVLKRNNNSFRKYFIKNKPLIWLKSSLPRNLIKFRFFNKIPRQLLSISNRYYRTSKLIHALLPREFPKLISNFLYFLLPSSN